MAAVDLNVLSSVVGTMDDAVVLLDADGKISYANEALRVLSGYSDQDLNSKTFADIVHPQWVDSFKSEMAELVKKPGIATSFIVRFIHKDKSVRTVDVRAKNMLASPELNTMFFVMRDMTLKYVAQYALKNSEDQHRMILESSKCEIMVIDGAGKIEYLNEAAAAPMGGNPFIFIKKTLPEVYPHEKAQEYINRAVLALKTGKRGIYHSEIKVGTNCLSVIFDYSPVKDEGTFKDLVVITATDISEIEK